MRAGGGDTHHRLPNCACRWPPQAFQGRHGRAYLFNHV